MEAAPQFTPEQVEKAGRAMRPYHILVLMACVAVIAVSALATPDPRGYGTHEQLHLPPCTFHYLTHIRCPFCGLTTSFAYTLHLQLAKAFEAHPAGPVFVAIFAVQIPFRVIILAGKKMPFSDHPTASLWAWRGMLGLALVGWLIRLLLYGP